MTPLINVITRTSGRPNSFKRCVNSINRQTYKNINHIIIADDINDLEYIHNAGCSNIKLVDRGALIRNDNTPDPGTGSYSPHNLYLNQVKDKIKDGWILYLDDDDLFMDKNSVETIVKLINESDNDTIIYWQMILQNKTKLPNIINDQNPPYRGGIGSPCFTVNTKYIDYILWDSWKCADFRVIEMLHNIIPKYKFTPKPLIFIPKANFGKKNDIK